MRAWIVPLLAVALGAIAGPSPAKEAKAPFIARSLVLAPRVVGDYRLADHGYDPSNRFAGVRLRYFGSRHPTVPIDVFVYPAGRMDAKDALDAEEKELRDSLGLAAKAGYYSDPAVVAVRTLELDPGMRPSASGSDELAPGIAAALTREPLVGRSLLLGYRKGEQAQRSAGVLAYKQLYFFKGRLTMPADMIEADAFDAFTDDALKTLIPAIEVMHDGACSERTIALDVSEKDPDKQVAALMQQIAMDAARGVDENCVPAKRYAKEKADTGDRDVIEIAFEPDDWKSR